MRTVLTIAGSDSSGGAGIQADIKTITMHGLYASSAITALTAQNTLGVSGVMDVPPEFVSAQLDSIFTDIRPDAVKIGMLPNRAIIAAVANKLKEYDAVNIVLDPVMVATSGARLMLNEAVGTLIKTLFPLAMLVTPNIPEAEALSGIIISSPEDMEKAAEIISAMLGSDGSVLIKGGHFTESANDLLYDGTFNWIKASRVVNENTHGTGCTLSSAIACGLAEGYNLLESVKSAKQYVTKAISMGLDLGRGRGPLNHMCR